VTLLQSGITGFYPVYFVLDRTCPEELATGGAKSQG